MISVSGLPLLGNSTGCPNRAASVAVLAVWTLSEALTLVIWFHLSGYRGFKHLYLRQLCTELRSEFPHLPSYGRMMELLPATFVPLCAFLRHSLAAARGIAFIDSFPLKVCHNRRIHSHRVFAGVA